MGAISSISKIFAGWKKKSLSEYPGNVQVAPLPAPYNTARSFLFGLKGSFAPATYQANARNYGENVYLFRAVEYFATACAGIKLKLYTNATKTKEITDHPFLVLLRKPDTENTSQAKLIHDFVAYSLLSGNGYLLAVKNGNKPSGLFALRPDAVDVQRNKLNRTIYTYTTVASQTASTDATGMLHYKWFHPLNDLLGLSPVAVAATLVEQMNAGTQWNAALLQNAGRPSGALITSGSLGDTNYEELKRQVEESYSGISAAGRPLLLEGGLDWKQFSLSPLDMDWLKSKESNARDISLALGVPPELLGDSSNKTYSNYGEARASFFMETVLPFMDSLMALFNAWFPSLYPGETLYLDYDKSDIEALQEDRAAVIQRVNDQFKSGYMLASEARKEVGLTELPDTDFFTIPTGVAVVMASDIAAFAAKSVAPPPTPTPTPTLPGGTNDTGSPNTTTGVDTGVGSNNSTTVDSGTNTQNDTTNQTQAGDNTQAPPDASAPPPIAKDFLPLKEVKAVNLTAEEKAVYWNAFEGKRQGWYDKIEANTKAYFQAEHARIQDALKSAKTTTEAMDNIEKALNQSKQPLTKLLTNTYISVGRDFGKATFSSINSRVEKKAYNFNQQQPVVNPPSVFDVWASVVPDWLQNHAGTKITQISDVTRQDIVDRLAEGVKNGESIYQLADRIKGLYAEYYKGRSESIARTEVIASSNLGAIAGAMQTGLKLKKEWISTNDARTRPSHREANGQVVPQDKPFSVQGEPLDYPGDISHGAKANNIIQCRCTVGFIYDDSADNATQTDAAATAKHQELERLIQRKMRRFK